MLNYWTLRLCWVKTSCSFPKLSQEFNLLAVGKTLRSKMFLFYPLLKTNQPHKQSLQCCFFRYLSVVNIIICGSQSVGPCPVASLSPGNLLEMQIDAPLTDSGPLTQKLWLWGPAVCIWASPLGDSHACLRNHCKLSLSVLYKLIGNNFALPGSCVEKKYLVPVLLTWMHIRISWRC